MQSPSEKLAEIKASKNLVDLVSVLVDLRAVGPDDFVGRCPFHTENTASFRVNQMRYHCFGCHAHGDIFSWVVRTQGCTFPEAVRILSGGQLPSGGRVLRKITKTYCEYDAVAALDIIQTNETAQKSFLSANSIGPSRFTPAEIATWGIGCGNANLDGTLPLDHQIQAALAATSSEGRVYSRYWNRITIPLKGPGGHILGFLGRLIHDDGCGRPKYINPPETAAFARRRFLFGRDMLEHRPKAILLVEGAVDAIKCITRGLKNVVATMGCQITQEQLNLLEHYACPVYVFYDGDMAGLNATFEASKCLVGANFDSWHILLTADLDPDELQALHPTDDFRTLVAALPRIRSTDFYQGKIMSNELRPQYDRSLLDAMAKPYVDDNVKQGWPHYNVVDWVCAAYPQFAQGIREALRKMGTDVINENGVYRFKKEHVAAFLKEWMKPCREVRKAHLPKK